MPHLLPLSSLVDSVLHPLILIIRIPDYKHDSGDKVTHYNHDIFLHKGATTSSNNKLDSFITHTPYIYCSIDTVDMILFQFKLQFANKLHLIPYFFT